MPFFGDEEQDVSSGELKHKKPHHARELKETEESVASLEKAEASAKDAPKMKSHKMPEESVEEYFRRMSEIREMIHVCQTRKKAELHNLTPGSTEYHLAMNRFKAFAIPYTTTQFHNRTEYHRFPSAIKQGIPWFDNLKSQFIEVTQRHHNVDLFANQVILQHDILQALFNFRRYAHYAPLVDLVAKSGLKWDEGMRPAIVLAGEKSCAKSYMLQAVSKMFFPGVFDDVTHRTAMSEMTSGQNDLLIRAMDETPAWLLGGGTGASAKEFEGSAANSANKSLQTNKRGHTRTIDTSDGDRKSVDFYSSNIGTALYATNVRLPPASSPAIARLIVVTVDCVDPTNEDAIEKLLLKLQEPELDAVKQDALETRQLINFYVMLFELYIAMGIVTQIQMDAWVIYFQRYCEKMQSCGFVLADPKKVVQITELARTMTLVYAIQIGLFSEISYNERMIDPLNPSSGYVKFWDNAPYFIDLVDAHCVCTRSIMVYVVSLCRDMWANKLRLDILSAANAATVAQFPDVFDASCFDEDQTKRRLGRAAKAFENTMSIDESGDTNVNNDNSCEIPPELEEDVINYDDYGFEHDLDASDLRPDDEGNYLKKSLADGPAPREIDAREYSQLMNSSSSQLPAGAASKRARVASMDTMPENGNSRLLRSNPITDVNSQSGDAQTPAASEPEDKALQIFMCEYPKGDGSIVSPNPNYIELRGAHMSLMGACELLVQQVKDGNRPSVNNIATELSNMEECDITVPIYVIQDKKVVRTNRMHTIKMVRLENNTPHFDPNGANGSSAVRVYVALHSVLNNHSLTKAIIRSIRNLGFVNSIPGRCIINIPVQAYRYPKDANVPGNAENQVMTMYGINRIVRIVPRNDPFIYVKNNTMTREMLDLLVGMRRGSATISVSPSLLNCMHGLYISCEPEIEAAVQHAKIRGAAPGAPLYNTPVLLEKLVAELHLEIPNLRSLKLYSYPRRKMDEYRLRYFITDAHDVSGCKELVRRFVSSSTDSTYSARTGKRAVPETELLRAIASTGTRALVELLASSVALARNTATFGEIINRYDQPDELRKRLLEIGVSELEFMRCLRDSSFAFDPKRTASRHEIGNMAKEWRNIKEAENRSKKLADGNGKVSCPEAPKAISFTTDFTLLDEQLTPQPGSRTSIINDAQSTTLSSANSAYPSPAAPAAPPSTEIRIFAGVEKLAGVERLAGLQTKLKPRGRFLLSSTSFVDIEQNKTDQ